MRPISLRAWLHSTPLPPQTHARWSHTSGRRCLVGSHHVGAPVPLDAQPIENLLHRSSMKGPPPQAQRRRQEVSSLEGHCFFVFESLLENPSFVAHPDPPRPTRPLLGAPDLLAELPRARGLRLGQGLRWNRSFAQLDVPFDIGPNILHAMDSILRTSVGDAPCMQTPNWVIGRMPVA